MKPPPMFEVQVTRKEFNKLPMAIRRRALAEMARKETLRKNFKKNFPSLCWERE